MDPTNSQTRFSREAFRRGLHISTVSADFQRACRLENRVLRGFPAWQPNKMTLS